MIDERSEWIRLRGLVQGVGMRPAVWRLAREFGLRGSVWNDDEGVGVHVAGPGPALDAFAAALPTAGAPLAHVETMVRRAAERFPAGSEFSIQPSRRSDRPAQTAVVPDAATCPACLREVMEPAQRRYRYPFANCTACGPRLSITEAIPYDRPGTTMRAFALCASCQREYEDPADRRFHAQPIACPRCGPRAWLEDAQGALLPWPAGAADVLEAAAGWLRDGRILAIKGLGGFQLACDATQREAVQRLRARKRRWHKPFAVMVRDLAQARDLAVLSADEEAVLASSAAPIVLVAGRPDHGLAPELAPGVATLGIMLPNTPLHHLLLAQLAAPIVLTSGNLSDEPQAIGNAEARERLGGIADAFLTHDRAIARRIDDSVVRCMAQAPRVLRRARGYAPAPIPLPPGLSVTAPVLACGGDLKNSICLLRGDDAIVSHHIGDLHGAPAQADARRALDQYLALFRCAPDTVAVDLHPDYRSAALGRALAAEHGVPLETVQHHHAHAAACLADNGWPLNAGAALAVVMDGLGHGEDGSPWGGEFLLADYRHCRRLASLAPVALPGGDRAAREPWRNTYAQLRAAPGWHAVLSRHGRLDIVRFLQAQPLGVLDRMIATGLNSPAASSCGRLFDAVAAACGICREAVRYEGQAAIELEAAAASAPRDDGHPGYPLGFAGGPGVPRLDPAPLWPCLLHDLQQGAPVAQVAARFHRGLAQGIAGMVEQLAARHAEAALVPVLLSGGVFHNRLLLEALLPLLQRQGRRVLTHRMVPAGDGGLALGQAVIAAARATAVS